MLRGSKLIWPQPRWDQEREWGCPGPRMQIDSMQTYLSGFIFERTSAQILSLEIDR
jgi:hypothetical protein